MRGLVGSWGRRTSILLVCWFTGCGGDNGVADASLPCTSAAACDDGNYCNGSEACTPGNEGADARGCTAGASPCMAGRTCDEASESCASDCDTAGDADGDSERAVECGGADCDDGDPQRYPGASEVCEVANRDEDCDPMTFGYRDSDSDGYPDARCCNVDGAGEMRCGSDCDDLLAGANPMQAEVCNGVDDDCDALVDEGVVGTFYPDGDMDGWPRDDGAPVRDCMAPDGYVAETEVFDCDDTTSSINPGLPERCDQPGASGSSIDENCDGITNPPELCECNDGQSRGCMEPGRCAAGSVTCVDGRWTTVCSVSAMPEACNNEDDDCDGQVDEGTRITCYPDGDGDFYAPATGEMSFCLSAGCPVGYREESALLMGVDCDDNSATTNPVAPEVCDGLDNDCRSGGGAAPNEDYDGDGHTTNGPTAGCSGGFPTDDCYDYDGRVFPNQTLYFSTPRCAATYRPCVDDPALCCCLNPMTSSCLLLGNRIPPTGYDFDCDGAGTRQPAAVCAACSQRCGTSGPATAPGTTACGTPVQYEDCGFCITGMTGCTAPTFSTAPLRCL